MNAKRAKLNHKDVTTTEGASDPGWRTALQAAAQSQVVHARVVPTVAAFSRDDVIKRLEAVLQRVLADIVAGRNAKLSFEEHHSYKSIEFDFVTKCHRPVAEPSLTTLALRSNKTLKSFVVMLRIMEVVHELLLSNKHATKRDIYYMDVTLFEKQAIVDRAIENIASMLHVPRTALHVVGTEKSLVAGHVNWKEKGDTIDCMHYLHTGKPIPGDTNRIEDLRTDARFLLIVEDHATFMRLLNDGFVTKYGPCALLTGKGVPDLAARRFVRMLKDTLPSLVVLALCDYDPWGLQILCTYAFGSLRMTYDAESLATPELLWLGVHDEDLKKWELPAACFANLTDVDKRKGETMLSMPALQAKPTWRNQLKSMLAGGKKIEMQALSSLSISFLCDTFLPDKMAKTQWL